MLVMSGGEGYIDFRIGELSDTTECRQFSENGGTPCFPVFRFPSLILQKCVLFFTNPRTIFATYSAPSIAIRFEQFILLALELFHHIRFSVRKSHKQKS